MFSQLETLVGKDEVRAVILTSAFEKAFSAGDDVKGGPQNSDEAVYENELARDCLSKIRNFSAPLIAAIDGYAMGGGMVLALQADWIIASDRSKYGFGEINFGMPINWASTLLLGKGYPFPQIKHLLMSGERFSAEEARELNLVQQVVSAEVLLEEAIALAQLYASKAPLGVRAIKALMNASASGINEGGHLALENYLTRMTFDSEDVAEGTKAFAEKRDPVWRGR